MTIRNLSPQKMFHQMALEHKPSHAFHGKDKRAFQKWKRTTFPKVVATLGKSPDRVPLRAQKLVEWEHDGLHKERWIIDVQKHMSATLLINRPAGLGRTEKLPAILCCHGHGPFGKEPVMGNDSSEGLRENIAAHGYNYGHEMARCGYVTYAIDWIGFGERNDSQKPNHLIVDRGRDWCNLYYLHATMLGMTSLSINVVHGKAATDFASTQPHVDPKRLGVMGLSGGGTMTLWMALCDSRFKAAEIICYSDLWAYFGSRDANYCGMQVAPGLFELVDMPDLQGLLAPNPLLIDIGIHDTCFKVDTAMMCYRKLEKIYKAAGASDRLALDLHNGEHGWQGNKSDAFFGAFL